MKSFVKLSLMCLFITSCAVNQQSKIYWASETPKRWNGSWSEKFQTAAEKSNFTRTASNNEILDFFAMMKWNSENMYVYNMFTSDLRRNCPVIVMANPRVTSPREAAESGKTVVYLQGGIHPSECEGKEALMMLIRDILIGDKKYLLDKLIILCCPNFNVDGNESWSIQPELPNLAGIRENATGFDINRDAIKLETTNMQGLCRNLFNNWDPTVILDTHLLEITTTAYSITYTTSTIPAAHPEPGKYVSEKLLPAVRKAAFQKGGIEIFTYGRVDKNSSPTLYSPERALWTTEAKFLVNAYGLRNRMAILVETPGFESFEKRIYSQYVFARELLEYVYENGEQMQQICKQADEDVVNKILNEAHTGKVKNYIAGKYESAGKADIYAYEKLVMKYLPGTSVLQTALENPDEPPLLHKDLELLTKPVGTEQAVMPRGYLIPADMEFIVEKLRLHNVKVDVLEKPVAATGQEYVIDKMSSIKKPGYGQYEMTILEGEFIESPKRQFPAGTFKVDMAQPTANLAFYCLEPQVGDGFAGWRLLDDYLKKIGVNEQKIVYPIYKYFEILEE